MVSNLSIVQELYHNFHEGNMDAIKEKFDRDIVWIQMKGFPGGGEHIGFDEIVENVFQNFRQNWSSWKAEVDEFLDAGESIMAVGRYKGTFGETGKSMVSEFVHRYVLKEGKIIRFVQYTDTQMVAEAMS